MNLGFVRGAIIRSAKRLGEAEAREMMLYLSLSRLQYPSRCGIAGRDGFRSGVESRFKSRPFRAETQGAAE